jgi:hypothetical protein
MVDEIPFQRRIRVVTPLAAVTGVSGRIHSVGKHDDVGTNSTSKRRPSSAFMSARTDARK